jgi:prevent-host-death family protein
MLVAVRELKANLSRVLSRARSGEMVEVTSHNKPIVRIVGIPAVAGDGLRRLMDGGALSWNGGRPRLGPPRPLSPVGTPLSRIVREDRG